MKYFFSKKRITPYLRLSFIIVYCIACILEANVFQFFAALYAETLSVGTYIAQSLVLLKAFVALNVGGVTLLNVILFKLVHVEKVYSLIFVTPLPTTISVKPLQETNALSPRLVTLSGIVTLVKPVQLAKALLPILVTPLPIVTLVKLLQLLKALLPILVTLSGIVTDVKPLQL